PRNHDFQYLLDADVHYYSQSTALTVISQIPTSRVIFLIREPVARIVSSFHFMKNNEGALPLTMTLTEYVNECRARALSRMPDAFGIESPSGFPGLCYFDHISLWNDALGPDRITYVFFEDLVRSPRKTINFLMSTLGLPDRIFDGFSFGNERP